jgi:hypothetical protein
MLYTDWGYAAAPVCQEELLERSSCCIGDEGRPLGIDVRAWIPNHLKLLRLRVVVVSVKEKVLLGQDQVSIQEMNASEPPMRCRKAYRCCQNLWAGASQGSAWRQPFYRPGGNRHRGGMTWIQALIRNLGTCRFDAKRAVQVATTTRTRVPMRSTGTESPVVAMRVL